MGIERKGIGQRFAKWKQRKEDLRAEKQEKINKKIANSDFWLNFVEDKIKRSEYQPFRFISPGSSFYPSSENNISRYVTIDKRGEPYTAIFIDDPTTTRVAVVLREGQPVRLFAKKREEPWWLAQNPGDQQAPAAALQLSFGMFMDAQPFKSDSFGSWGGKYPDVDRVLAAMPEELSS